MSPTITVTHLSAIIGQFDGLIIEQQGVIDDGTTLYPGALEALTEIKAAGVRTIILSSSSKTDRFNIDRLTALGVDPELYERLVSTGQLLKQALVARSLTEGDAPRRYFLIASPEDAALFKDSRLTLVDSVEDADAIVLLTVSGAEADDPAFRAALIAVAQRGVPLYSPRADVQTLVPRGELGPGFASVLNLYRAEGGEVLLFGKPSGRIYARCRNMLDPIEEPRIGVIGEQFPSDIIGPQSMGMTPIFVGTGAGGLKGSGPAAIAAWTADLGQVATSYEIDQLTAMPGLIWDAD